MRTNELITIGMAVYNKERYIKKCLLSVLNQTYPEIEILIIDDKGTDTSMDIIRSMKAEHPRGKCIRIIENDKNEGVGISKSKLFENALGDYYYLIDADDEITPNCIELMYNKIVSLNVDMVCGSFRVDSENGTYDLILKDMVVRKENMLIEFFGPHNTMYITNKLYKTILLKENHISCPERLLEDVIMSFQIFSVIQSCCDISDITYFYHYFTPDSIGSDFDGKKNISVVLGLNSFFTIAHNKIQTLSSIDRIKIKEKFFVSRLGFTAWIIGGEHERYIKSYLSPDYLRDKDRWRSPILFSFYLFSLIPLNLQKKLIPFLLKIKKQLNPNK